MASNWTWANSHRTNTGKDAILRSSEVTHSLSRNGTRKRKSRMLKSFGSTPWSQLGSDGIINLIHDHEGWGEKMKFHAVWLVLILYMETFMNFLWIKHHKLRCLIWHVYCTFINPFIMKHFIYMAIDKRVDLLRNILSILSPSHRSILVYNIYIFYLVLFFIFQNRLQKCAFPTGLGTKAKMEWSGPTTRHAARWSDFGREPMSTS